MFHGACGRGASLVSFLSDTTLPHGGWLCVCSEAHRTVGVESMARFSFGRLLDNNRFEDFFAQLTGGSADHDHLNGTTGGNMLFGGGSADSLAGMAGNDRLYGGTGDDKVW